MFEAAVRYMKSGHFQKAEEVLLNIIYDQPSNFDANHMLGVVYSELVKIELAEKHFKLASSIDPNHPPLYQNWGLLLSKQRRFEEAIDKFNLAISLAPNFPPVYSNRGNALKELGRYREAIIDHNRAINLAPQFFGFYCNRGNTLREQKEYTAALSDYDRAIQLNPNYADAFNGRGNVFYDLKPLFDTPLYTKHLEAAYEAMYHRYQAGLPPDHIRVSRTDNTRRDRPS
jgi:tetratricopeptide (TPR) repeat protein